MRMGVPGAAGAGVNLDCTNSQHVSNQSRHVMFAWNGLSRTRFSVFRTGAWKTLMPT